MSRPACLFLLFTAALTAQTPTGEVRGRVVDPSGANVASAAVALVNTGTNVKLSTAANTEGNFLFRNLNPGIYRLEVARDGFKRLTRGNLEVRVGDVVNLELALEVGATTESITVTAETPLLESANAVVGQVMDRRRIEDLPAPGNSVLYLLQLVPGATVNTAPTNLWPPDALGSGSGTTLGGGRAGSNEFALDGAPMMTRSGGFTLNPPSEMVQELRITTGAYDASLGRFQGGYVNMVLKSGTNAFHGSVFYQNLSRGMIAKDFFTQRFINDPRTGPVTPEKIEAAWPPQRVLRLQANAGGAVRLPFLYDGRNRTFWTFGGDGVSRQRASRNTYNVPPLAQREGDFSALLALGAQYQIYDPATIAAAPGGRFSRQPFAGNRVPASRFDPIARQLLTYYPSPNTPANPDGTGNYTDPNLANSPYQGYLGRVDHNYSSNHRAFVSFNLAYTDPVSERFFHNDATGTIRTRRQKGITYEHTYTMNAATILNFRYGLNRFADDTAAPSQGFDLGTLGLAPGLVRALDAAKTTLPGIAINGLTAFGGGAGSIPRTTYHNLLGQATHVRGNHTLRSGVEFRSMLENVWSLGAVSPSYTFDTAWTRGPLDNSAGSPVGQGLAAFLLGRPSSGFIDRNGSSAEASRYWGVFVQDDWKLTRKLTMNVGLRWDYDTPTTERFNRASRGFAFGTASPVEAQARANYAANPIPEVPVSQFRVQGGLLFAGLNGAPRGLFAPDRNNFSPRVGFAYAWRPRTVLRAGYGLFFEPLGSDRLDTAQPGFNQRTVMAPSLDNGLTFAATLANPYPNGLLDPAGASAGLNTFIGQSISITNPARRNAYAQRWSFNLQQELPGRFLLDLGYMGNKALGLATSPDLNAVPAQYLSRSASRDNNTNAFLTAQVRNPFAGIAAFNGSGLQGANVARQQLLRPYPQFGSISTVWNNGFAWYHSLQARLERRLANGFTVQASYTWSKSMEAVDYLNASDTAPSRVVSPLDQTHVWAMSGVYELPFGKQGRRVTKLAVGGWSLQGLWQAQSGRPLAWGNVIFNGDLKSIPLARGQRDADRWFNTAAGFERNAAQQLVSNLRTFPFRLNGVRAPGVNLTNLSVSKNFALTERWRLQFRAEAVDAFNTTLLSTPNTAPTSGQFGQITTIGNGNTQRRVTLGGKIVW